jgi:hypothetical protein
MRGEGRGRGKDASAFRIRPSLLAPRPSPLRAGPSAAVRVAAEEGPDVPPETGREGRPRRPAAGPSEGQVNQQVLGAAPRDHISFIRPDKDVYR